MRGAVAGEGRGEDGAFMQGRLSTVRAPCRCGGVQGWGAFLQGLPLGRALTGLPALPMMSAARGGSAAAVERVIPLAHDSSYTSSPCIGVGTTTETSPARPPDQFTNSGSASLNDLFQKASSGP